MSTKKHTKRTKSKESDHAQFEEIDTIASKLDEIYRRRLPDGVIQDGILKGMEPELRQDALLMAVGGFLYGSTHYKTARESKDELAMQRAMELCAALTLRYCKERTASQMTRLRTREIFFDESFSGSYPHPTQIPPSEWSSDLKAAIVMRSLRMAVRSGKLSVANASLAAMVCAEGKRVSEIAVVWKISESAAYQQIKRVRRVLPEVMEHIDSCLL